MSAIAQYPDGTLGPRELCLSCVKVLPVQRAAITVGVASATWETLGASDDRAMRIERHQIVAGEGPAVDAAACGGPVLVDDLSAQFDRWPGFTTTAGDDARGALFAFPLQIGAISVGVLDLSRDEPPELQPADMLAISGVTDIVTMVLLSRPAHGGTDGQGPDSWWIPSPSSTEIHQATGMVVAQLSVPPSVAYLRLRAYAFARDQALVDVARDVIERRLRFDPEDAH